MNFMPHGHCFFWTPEVLWPWVIGNGLTALAYSVIPFLLIVLWRRRPDLVPTWAAFSFGMFIVSCGAGHVMKIVTLWYPYYYLGAWLDVFTGVISWPAAFGLMVTIRNVGRILTQSQIDDLWAVVDTSLQSAPIAIFLIARDGTILWAAGSAVTLTSIAAQDLMGRTIQDTIGNRPRLMRGYAMAFEGKSSDIAHVATNGHSYMTKFRPVKHPRVAACATTIDITTVTRMVPQSAS